MKTLHALLVDDDKQALETMGMILEMDDYKVSTADSGRSALERLESGEADGSGPDFLVVDLDMGNLSGIELLTEMRKRGHSLPVMVVTGFASKGTVVELLRQGVSDFLDKPIHLEEFRIRVHGIASSALKRRKHSIALSAPQSSALSEGLATPYQAAAIMDFAGLGLPHAVRRKLGSNPESNVVLAARKRAGYDILFADAGGAGAESFYLSVLVKSYFDKCRNAERSGAEFLPSLETLVREGALGQPKVLALYLRIFREERRIEAHAAGYPSQWFLGSAEGSPHWLWMDGAPLCGGASTDTAAHIPYRPGDRLFIHSPKTPAAGPLDADPSAARAMAELRSSILALPQGNLQVTADAVWAKLQAEPGGRDDILLGLELP